jgi:hypothetical protein
MYPQNLGRGLGECFRNWAVVAGKIDGKGITEDFADKYKSCGIHRAI